MNRRWLLIGIGLGLLAGLVLGGFLVLLEATTIAKPAVYFYPTTATNVSVRLQTDELVYYSNPQGAMLSPARWDFLAQPGSQLLTNGQSYPYLFYETTYLGRHFQTDSGWSIARADLPIVLPGKLKELGLNDAERAEFMAYWSPRLSESPYYSVYPVSRDQIDQKLAMAVMPHPDRFIRVLLGFKPTATSETLTPPAVVTPDRSGFTVVEWGGFFV